MNHELLLLYSQSFEPLSFSESSSLRLVDEFRLMYSLDPHSLLSAVAYVVSNSVARKLVEIIPPIRNTPDSWGHFLEAGAFDNVRCVVPYPTFPALMESTIGYTDRDSVIFKVKHFVEKHNIFPLAQLVRMKRRSFHNKMTRYEITKTTPRAGKLRDVSKRG